MGNKIGSDNIVNMGENIYGSVNAKCAGNGLLYKLSKVKFCDVSGGTGQCLDVIRGGHGKDIVNAAVSKPKKNDFSVNQKFRFLSFGFEDLSNQNEVEAACTLTIHNPAPSWTMSQLRRDTVVSTIKHANIIKTSQKAISKEMFIHCNTT